MDKKTKCLVLLSGGLDSFLAARLMQRLGHDVVGICFVSPFFSCEGTWKGAAEMGIRLVVEDVTDDMLEILKSPKHGFGRNMNPCIDCHTMMVRRAMEAGRREGADFIATGEVLGERPMSQNRQALDMVARESGAGEYLLRPLSAKLLPPTLPEKLGWVNREELLGIEGRSRKIQLQLAREWGVKGYKNPAGGCLLTDPEFSRRLKDLMARIPDFNREDVELLKIGRHFWEGNNRIVIGRNERENEILAEISLPTDFLFKEGDIPGPTALIRTTPPGGTLNPDIIRTTANLLGRYGKGKKPLSTGEIIQVQRDKSREG